MKNLYRNLSVFVLTISIVIISACNNRKTKVAEKICEVEVDPVNQFKVKAGDLFNSFHLIRLQTSDNCLIGFVSKLIIKNNKLFLLSPGPQNIVTVFDTNGRFLNRIKKVGRGPGEYTDLQDIQVNSFLWLLDQFGRKLIKYDLNGSFVEEIPIGFFADKFEFMNSDTIIFYSNNRINEINGKAASDMLIFFSLQSRKILKTCLPMTKNMEGIGSQDYNNFNLSGEKLTFSQSFCDTVYEINRQLEVFPRYFFDFGKYRVPPELFQTKYNNVKDLSMAIMKRKCVFRFGNNFRELGDIIFATFLFDRQLLHLYYSKKTKEIRIIREYSEDSSIPILSGPVSIEFQPVTTFAKYLTFIVEPEYILKLKSNMTDVDWKILSEQNPEMSTIVNTLSIEDNPIILMYEINEF